MSASAARSVSVNGMCGFSLFEVSASAGSGEAGGLGVGAEIGKGYRNATGAPSERRGTTGGALPPQVARPQALMLRAVEVAGDKGLTLQEMRELFARMGQERFADGLAKLRSTGALVESTEKRPNRAGRLQDQVILRGR